MDNFVEKKNLIRKNKFYSYWNYSFVALEKKIYQKKEKKIHKLFVGNIFCNLS